MLLRSVRFLAAFRGVSGSEPGFASVSYNSALDAERSHLYIEFYFWFSTTIPVFSFTPRSLCAETPIPESLTVTGVEVFCRSFACVRELFYFLV